MKGVVRFELFFARLMIVMKTRIYTPTMIDDPNVQADIRQTLLSGNHVIFPTETVYGIGASALHESGIQKIYAVKGRPRDNPLIMHVPSIQAISPYVYIDYDYVNTLMTTFWPGPLTLVCRKRLTVPKWISGELDTVAIRIPSHPVALKILQIAGVPICAPSANLSGRPSSTLFEHVLEDFDSHVDIIIDGGRSEVGLESTVLDVTREVPVILRPGVITQAMLKAHVGTVDLHNDLAVTDGPRAPGMKYKHYAPKGELTLVQGDKTQVIEYINAQIATHQNENKKVGVLLTDDMQEAFPKAVVHSLGDAHCESDLAANLYIGLWRI